MQVTKSATVACFPMEAGKGTWKERDSRHSFYELVEKISEDSKFVSNWHGVPITREEPVVKLPKDFLARHAKPHCS